MDVTRKAGLAIVSDYGRVPGIFAFGDDARTRLTNSSVERNSRNRNDCLPNWPRLLPPTNESSSWILSGPRRDSGGMALGLGRCLGRLSMASGFPDLYVCSIPTGRLPTILPTAFTTTKLATFANLADSSPCSTGCFRTTRRHVSGGPADLLHRQGGQTSGPASGWQRLGRAVWMSTPDGKPDIHVANDTDEKFLYMNRSQARGSLELWRRRPSRSSRLWG